MNKGSLIPKGYMPRLIDEKLSEYLDIFGAVEVAGTMWCGKTWTSMAFGESITRIGTSAARETAHADPSTALIGDRPHVIDEWQDVPEIWDEVRNVVDLESGSSGMFILTGSSQPNKDKVFHSGAGRIKKIRMSTMTLSELGISNSKVSLSGLFRGEFEPVLVQQKLPPIADYICKGGWPRLMNSELTVVKPFIDSYLEALFDVNIQNRGFDGNEARKVMLSIARNLGNSLSLSTVAADCGFSPKDGKVNKYLSVLEDLYVLEPLQGWDAPIKSKNRLRTKPKYYFADSSIAANLLRIKPQRLVENGQLFGVLFEALCIHDLGVYASLLPDADSHPLYYYKDADGLEVDAIIELTDGRWAAIEIKLGENKIDEAANNLNRLKKKVLLNEKAHNREPEFMAVIVGAGELARFDKERGIYVIPITALGK